MTGEILNNRTARLQKATQNINFKIHKDPLPSHSSPTHRLSPCRLFHTVPRAVTRGTKGLPRQPGARPRSMEWFDMGRNRQWILSSDPNLTIFLCVFLVCKFIMVQQGLSRQSCQRHCSTCPMWPILFLSSNPMHISCMKAAQYGHHSILTPKAPWMYISPSPNLHSSTFKKNTNSSFFFFFFLQGVSACQYFLHNTPTALPCCLLPAV